jgi:spore germination protein YaaH
LTGRAAARHPILAAVGLAVTIGLVAVGCTPKRDTTGWIAYWETASGRASVDANGDLFSEVSPFWFRAVSATTIVSDEPAGDRADVVALARSQNIPLIPAVRDGTPAHVMAGILANPSTRASHVAALVNLVVANGYAGIDLDYEQFAFGDGSATWATTRPLWVQFVTELSVALHARARLLTVTVPPVYNGTRASGSGYWVYDWAGIAPFVDRLRIMAYDFSFSSPGPIAPLWWVADILQYAVNVVPKAKIQIGVPAYGRSWVTSITGTCPSGVSPGRFDVRMANAPAFVKSKGATPVRDARSGELTFSYVDSFTGPPPPPPTTTTTTAPTTTTIVPPTSAAVARHAAGPGTVTCVVRRTAWYSDASTMLSRVKLVGRYGISGMSQWALGFEDAAQWPALRQYSATLPKPPGVNPIGRLEVVSPGSRRVAVKGWALDPEADLPITVAVTIGGVSVAVLANRERPDIAAAYDGSGPFHGFATTVTALPGPRQVCVEARGIGPGPTTRLGCATVTVGA